MINSIIKSKKIKISSSILLPLIQSIDGRQYWLKSVWVSEKFLRRSSSFSCYNSSSFVMIHYQPQKSSKQDKRRDVFEWMKDKNGGFHGKKKIWNIWRIGKRKMMATGRHKKEVENIQLICANSFSSWFTREVHHKVTL